jgi:cysteine synthase
MREGILSLIGNTPLMKLTRVLDDIQFNLFAKLEGFNPGGSIKDRAAYSILKHAMEEGRIMPDTVVIESSSGNMGIGLAQACTYFGLRFICVVDPKTTQQNVELLKAYGAEVELVAEPDPITKEFLHALMSEPSKIASGLPVKAELRTRTAEARSRPRSRFPGNEEIHFIPATSKSPPR